MALSSVIANSNKVPGIYLQVSLGVGVRSGGDGERRVILFGNKLSTANLVVAKEREVFGADEVASLAGSGSELHEMAKAAYGAWSRVPMSIVAIAESAGANATNTITITGTATKVNTVRVWVGTTLVETQVNVTDTPTTIATAIVANCDLITDFKTTQTNVAGVITFVAKQKGPRGNHIRLRVEVVDPSDVVAAAIGGSGTHLEGGTTSDDPQNAIDAIDSLKGSFLVIPYDAEDAGASQPIDDFLVHVTAEDDAEIGNRKVVVGGAIGTEATADNIPAYTNEPRFQTVWMEASAHTPAELAAAFAAIRAKHEPSDPAFNFDGYIIPGLQGHPDRGDIPDNNTLIAALNSGLTPITSNASGRAVLVRSVTNKFQDSSGGADYRVLDTHKVAVPDAVANRIEVYVADQYGGFKAAADSDYPEGQAPPPGVVTESLLKDALLFVLKEFELGQLYPPALVNVDALAEDVIVELSAIAAGKFNAVIPLDVIELFHQFAGDVRQVG